MIIKTSINIVSNPKKVFSWISEPEKAMQWQKGVKSFKIIQESSEKVGTSFKEEMNENGNTLEIFGEISAYTPDKLISFNLVSKIHSVFVNYSVSGDNNKSFVMLSSKIKWKFPMSLLSLMIGKKIKSKILKQTKSELKELKTLCESEKTHLS